MGQSTFHLQGPGRGQVHKGRNAGPRNSHLDPQLYCYRYSHILTCSFEEFGFTGCLIPFENSSLCSILEDEAVWSFRNCYAGERARIAQMGRDGSPDFTWRCRPAALLPKIPMPQHLSPSWPSGHPRSSLQGEGPADQQAHSGALFPSLATSLSKSVI